MNNIEAVGCVKLQALLLVELASEVHVEHRFPELALHEVVKRRLFKQHRLQLLFVRKYVCQLDKGGGALLILVESLEEFDHHE